MSDDQVKIAANEEPGDEVEGHMRKFGTNEEPADEAGDEVEAHGHGKFDSAKYDSKYD